MWRAAWSACTVVGGLAREQAGCRTGRSADMRTDDWISRRVGLHADWKIYHIMYRQTLTHGTRWLRGSRRAEPTEMSQAGRRGSISWRLAPQSNTRGSRRDAKGGDALAIPDEAKVDIWSSTRSIWQAYDIAWTVNYINESIGQSVFLHVTYNKAV